MVKNTYRKISGILSSSQKKKYAVQLILTLFGMVLESLGLGLLIPTISLIINPDFLESLSTEYGIHFFNSFSYETSLVIILSIMGSLYLVKTLYLTYVIDRQNKFLFGLNAFISKLLYSKYLKQSYTFFLETNTAEVTKNIMVEVQLLTKYFIALMHLFNESLLLLTVFLTLILIEPIGVLSIGALFLLFGYFYFRLTNKRIFLYGEKRKEFDGKISKLILEGYGGSKEIKLLGRENYFIYYFNELNDQKKIISANQTTLTQLPRLYVELLAFLSVIGLVGVMLFQDQPTAQIISKVGVFVVAIFRVIPSYSKITVALQNIKYNSVALDVIHQKFQKLTIEEKTDEYQIEFNDQIEFDTVYFQYATSENEVLKNLNFKINKGETVGFIGSSGAGKSTVIDLLNGLLVPSRGEIKVDGISIRKCLKTWQGKIGYVPQQNFLTDASIASNIAFGLPIEKINQQKLSQAIKKAELESFIDSLPQGVETTVGERGLQISGGQMQRIGIARALYNDPEVLIFDEATSALDEKTEKNVLSAIRELKKSKTIIVITHRKNALYDCDRVFHIENGKLTQASMTI
jgi:ATP-binding cassette, subfamily B, bacterial PglK